MAKVSMQGKRFDTNLAHARFVLQTWVHDVRKSGWLYLSSKGTWYTYLRPAEQTGHDIGTWGIITAARALEQYDSWLSDDDKTRIATLAGLSWE